MIQSFIVGLIVIAIVQTFRKISRDIIFVQKMNRIIINNNDINSFVQAYRCYDIFTVFFNQLYFNVKLRINIGEIASRVVCLLFL